MSKFKNSWLRVDFPQKIHNDIKLINQVTNQGYCTIAVQAMRIGLKAIMSHDFKPTVSKESK